MIARLAGDRIDRLCADWQEAPDPVVAADAVRLFGPLAAWWLRQDVLDAAADYQPAYRCIHKQPELPGSHGSCWIVFAQSRPLPVLRRAFLLPVRWYPGQRHDPGLPSTAGRACRRDRQPASRDEEVVTAGWGLHLHDEAGLSGVWISEASG